MAPGGNTHCSATAGFSVNPGLGDWQSSYRRCRKDGIVFCQTHVTHSYILKKEHPPLCELYQ